MFVFILGLVCGWDAECALRWLVSVEEMVAEEAGRVGESDEVVGNTG